MHSREKKLSRDDLRYVIRNKSKVLTYQLPAWFRMHLSRPSGPTTCRSGLLILRACVQVCRVCSCMCMFLCPHMPMKRLSIYLPHMCKDSHVRLFVGLPFIESTQNKHLSAKYVLGRVIHLQYNPDAKDRSQNHSYNILRVDSPIIAPTCRHEMSLGVIE